MARAACALGLLATVCTGGACGDKDTGDPAKVVVLSIQSGASAYGLEPVVQWAMDNVNRAGGLGGRHLEPVFMDISQVRADDVARALFDDPEAIGLTGIFPSPIATTSISKKKLLVASSSTGADLYRKYAGQGYVWRTVESDIAQTKLLLLEAAKQGAKRVALLADIQDYGGTFFDWFGFFAAELSLEAGELVRYADVSESCEAYLDKALVGSPDTLVLALAKVDSVICVVRGLKARREAGQSGGTPRLLLSDSAYSPALVSELGQDAEGLVGFMPSEDPGSGFSAAYAAKFGTAPPAYAANTYDAILLMAYALAQAHHDGETGGLDPALRRVVDGRGKATDWTPAGIKSALAEIAAGRHPDVSGATGTLTFDSELYTDPVGTYYARWNVEGGQLAITEYITTLPEASGPQQSLARTLASVSKAQNLVGGASVSLPAKRGAWALVAATSSTWPNYRHQADALSEYQMLRSNGFDDDHIVLVLADDLRGANQNPTGEVRNVTGGPDVRQGAQIDYSGLSLRAPDLMAILKGDPRMPARIASGPEDNVYVFIVGHGGHQGVFVDVSDATYEVADADMVISPELLADTVREMSAHQQYRRMFIVIEACHSGVMGRALDAPNAFLLTAASPSESSLAANYMGDIGVWAADQFAYAFLSLASGDSTVTLPDAYRLTYTRVAGSHVSAYNAPAFGGLQDAKLAEFIFPGSP